MNRKYYKILLGFTVGLCLCITQVTANHSTPNILVYEGKLLDASSNPITTTRTFRFSLWSSKDQIAGDIDGAGAINIASPNYGGWQEEQDVTPNSDGTYSVKLGDATTLPDINQNMHRFLQIDIKMNGATDTTYELMDPTGDNGADTNDRNVIGSMMYAKNADMLDNAIDASISLTGEVELSFGDFLLSQILSWNPDGVSVDDGWFNFSDDVNIQGDLTVTGSITALNGGGVGSFIGITTATSDGIITSGADTGYKAANTICNNEYAGSHMCTSDEIANTIANNSDLTTVFTTGEQGWIFEGAPGFTANSNDCNGWVRNDNIDYYGAFWLFDTSGGGAGWLAPCNNVKPMTCCR